MSYIVCFNMLAWKNIFMISSLRMTHVDVVVLIKPITCVMLKLFNGFLVTPHHKGVETNVT
jgi:ABC-type Zn2+ transport system substrate-binding protein/surface adhesin